MMQMQELVFFTSFDAELEPEGTDLLRAVQSALANRSIVCGV